MDTTPPAPEVKVTDSILTPKARRPFVVKSFGLTDKGRVREANEDQYVIVELVRTMNVHGTSIPQAKEYYSSHRGHVFIVADGMGGQNAGDVASKMSVRTIEGFLLNTFNRYFNLDSPEDQTVLKEFRSALIEADSRLFEESKDHPELIGMGTTLTMGFAVDWRLFVAHAGDSRAYLHSGNKLYQLTKDHTIAAELVRKGALSPEEATRSPHRHLVTNVLGGHRPGVSVEIVKLDLEPGDVVLLCSDGLTEMVPHDRIAAILEEDRSPRAVCERLVAEANAKGGADNITVVVGSFHET